MGDKQHANKVIRIFVRVETGHDITNATRATWSGRMPFEKVKHLMTHWRLRGKPNRRPGTPP
jgi:hypothetical protein